MSINSTNNYKEASKLLSILVKALGIFMLCLFNFYNARNYTLDKNKIHVSSGTEIIEINSSESLEESKIYITSGASVLGIKENNFEIVKISDTKKHIASKSKAAKNTKHKTLETEATRQKTAQVFPKAKETFTLTSESDHVFSVHQNHTTVAAQNQNLSAKHVIKADDKTIRLSVAILSKAKIAAYFSYYKSKIYLNSSSIRPPPVLA